MVPYWSRIFEGLPECVADVREFIRKAIGDDDGADLVELVASELAGNAIRHSGSGEPEGQFILHVAALRNRWIVRVDDAGGVTEPHICASPAIKNAKDVDDYSDEVVETGRGLALVAAVSSEWGVFGDERARAVWAKIKIPGKNLL
ncbi:MAG: ATP-binding protein [Kribbellaceae bacterium]|nr:ATP-binding protein [Kribbellaceae bacterium]